MSAEAEAENEFNLFDELTKEEIQYLEFRKLEHIEKVNTILNLHGKTNSTEEGRDGQETTINSRRELLSKQRLLFNLSTNEHVVGSNYRTLRNAEPILVENVFKEDECQSVIHDAICVANTNLKEHQRGLDNESLTEEGWYSSRHSSFPTTDVPVNKLPKGTQELIYERIDEKVFPIVSQLTHIDRDFLIFRDVFIIKYSKEGQKGLVLHTDGCLVSFNILLNPKTDFEGGGTYFKLFDRAYHPNNIGDAIVHDARMEHSGLDVSAGCRYILVGFVDTVHI
ncbi:Procollagen-lysine,2-oxoglutarate 5-dioxygenase 1 [Zancudomyces culisetae]|uniref:Procollagen-lysine,2-oxoglutarate 5-dioxygenase 1 n=1 Tax=Zancudomyces culisetae TaxID=1213189 RepID=A0A1R1PMM0_ZANCU|nr:Procollagen-lysine,2-oxoglutarate 5-dioxygenase 1 [Zancudomyces culisetae]|eukprot:OMH82206.1 Procollagen-lysine,2-oxoglutarate 5-dioxygenase 1 [Zancudomyces culisetae]